MADQNITELPIKTNSGVAASDYMLGIDSAEGYQILIQDVAKYVVENYGLSSLLGSAQSVQSAFNALEDLTTPLISPSATATTVDANAISSTGWLRVASDSLSIPVAKQGMLYTLYTSSTVATQFFVTSDNITYYRQKWTDWQAWVQVGNADKIAFTDLSSQSGTVNLIPLVTSLYKGSYVYRIDNATEAPVTGGCIYKIIKTHTVNDTRCIITAIPMSADSPDVYTAFVTQNATAIVWQRKMSYYAPTRITNNTDLNTLTTPGSYYADTPTGITNTPSGLSSGVYRLDTISLANVTRADGTYVRICQIITDFYGNIWRRGARTRATANVYDFDDWKKVTTSEDLAPTTLTLTYTSNSYVSETDLNRLRVFKIGSLYVCNGNFSITNNMPTSTSDVAIGTISGWSSTYPINIDVPMQNGSGVAFISISTTGTVTLTNLSGVTIKGWCKFNASTI